MVFDLNGDEASWVLAPLPLQCSTTLFEKRFHNAPRQAAPVNRVDFANAPGEFSKPNELLQLKNMEVGANGKSFVCALGIAQRMTIIQLMP